MKKLLNDPKNVVKEMIDGVVISNPQLKKLGDHNVILRADCRDPAVLSKVALISGGGSGHEPAHAGYVGKGMLSAAVLGNVFSSPSIAQVLSAIRAVGGPAGVLLIVKNYTGDRLNFGAAMEIARSEGVKVEMLIVGDDVALPVAVTSRRGIAGTVFVHKIAGAAADNGLSLEEVFKIAKSAAENVVTMGIGLSPCIVPAAGKPTFTLEGDKVELGLGIHGEAGRERKALQSVDQHVDEILETIIKNLNSSNKRVALLINNLGATTAMELALVARHSLIVLEKQCFSVERVYNGPFMTALEMAGFSLSVIPVDDQTIQRLDHSVQVPGWPITVPQKPHLKPEEYTLNYDKTEERKKLDVDINDSTFKLIKHVNQSVIQKLISSADHLNDLDRQVGDGDLGVSMDAAGQYLIKVLDEYPWQLPSSGFYELSLTLQDKLGGTSGPLYTIFFARFSTALKGVDTNNPISWSKAIKAGIDGVMELGKAQVGYRTLLDALVPAYESFAAAAEKGSSAIDSLKAAVQAADDGVEKTKSMKPKLGRSEYLGERAIGFPDPGAAAVAIIFHTILDALSSFQ